MKKSDIKDIAAGIGRANEDLINEIKSFSMLHPETLRILWELAARSSGAVIELGPYIGGSTVAMGLGLKGRQVPFVTIEKGGEYLAHPTYPSADIIGDLQSNLRRFSLDDRVSIVHGHNAAPDTLASVKTILGGQKAGLLFIDSDGHLERDWPLYRPFLIDGAYVVFDDYESEGAPEKAAMTKPFVDRGVREGFLSDLGVYQWGTWVGRYNADVSMFGRLKRILVGR